MTDPSPTQSPTNSPQSHQPFGPENADPARPAHAAAVGSDPIDDARIAELLDQARSGEADLPVGAEDFAAALVAVAAQRDDHLARLQRTAADFQNFQRRAGQNEAEARRMGVAGVLQSVLMVVDYFDMALKQDPATATVDQVIGGVKLIKGELLRVLGNHGVALIQPAPGDSFDPLRHEAVEKRPAGDESAGIPAGHVVSVSAPGYLLQDRVIRSAKVVVAVQPDASA